MAFVATPRGVKGTLEFTQNGVPVVNVFNIDAGGAVTPAILASVSGILEAWWVSDLSNLTHTSLIFDRATATDISVANGLQSVVSTSTVANGAVTGAAMAANAAMVVSLRTPFTGRSFRGRIYVGGLPEASLSDAQHFAGAAALAMGNSFNNLMTALQAVGLALSVLSKYSNLVARVAGLLTEVTTLLTNTVIDSQRRRTAN